MEEKESWSLREASQELGVPTSRLRYYCNAGLVPQVRRTLGRHRVLAKWQLEWLATLVGLRKAGLGMTELRRYANWCREGKATLAERKALLATRRRQLWQELEDRQSAIDFLERREEMIDAALAADDAEGNDWI